MRAYLLAALVLSGTAGPALSQLRDEPVDPAATEAAGPHAALEDEVWSFLEAFIDGENTHAEQLAFFAERVHYYDRGVLATDAIARDIGYTLRRWPWRDNRLVEIEYLKPLPGEDRVFVSYVVDYEVANRERTVRGRARYGAVIAGIGDEPRIEGIFENITRRGRPGQD
ncbi:hypothetical protein [Noviherbaspirillum aridicola]|uniref:Nuclear transport factor 2 family protein n=1 Tax=Noviherbaspirillum aridicola TaxID=2849687 RepID=A0ABQ4PZS0_9BURK|nr:hypothetical protein [Noviherbaspirillum aridicola]GIZ50369.1 hypothetical protein NCCP691_03830 [Noviherbaspirillum aridicola]